MAEARLERLLKHGDDDVDTYMSPLTGEAYALGTWGTATNTMEDNRLRERRLQQRRLQHENANDTKNNNNNTNTIDSINGNSASGSAGATPSLRPLRNHLALNTNSVNGDHRKSAQPISSFSSPSLLLSSDRSPISSAVSPLPSHRRAMFPMVGGGGGGTRGGSAAGSKMKHPTSAKLTQQPSPKEEGGASRGGELSPTISFTSPLSNNGMNTSKGSSAGFLRSASMAAATVGGEANYMGSLEEDPPILLCTESSILKSKKPSQWARPTRRGMHNLIEDYKPSSEKNRAVRALLEADAIDTVRATVSGAPHRAQLYSDVPASGQSFLSSMIKEVAKIESHRNEKDKRIHQTAATTGTTIHVGGISAASLSFVANPHNTYFPTKMALINRSRHDAKRGGGGGGGGGRTKSEGETGGSMCGDKEKEEGNTSSPATMKKTTIRSIIEAAERATIGEEASTGGSTTVGTSVNTSLRRIVAKSSPTDRDVSSVYALRAQAYLTNSCSSAAPQQSVAKSDAVSNGTGTPPPPSTSTCSAHDAENDGLMSVSDVLSAALSKSRQQTRAGDGYGQAKVELRGAPHDPHHQTYTCSQKGEASSGHQLMDLSSLGMALVSLPPINGYRGRGQGGGGQEGRNTNYDHYEGLYSEGNGGQGVLALGSIREAAQNFRKYGVMAGVVSEDPMQSPLIAGPLANATRDEEERLRAAVATVNYAERYHELSVLQNQQEIRAEINDGFRKDYGNHVAYVGSVMTAMSEGNFSTTIHDKSLLVPTHSHKVLQLMSRLRRETVPIMFVQHEEDLPPSEDDGSTSSDGDDDDM